MSYNVADLQKMIVQTAASVKLAIQIAELTENPYSTDAENELVAVPNEGLKVNDDLFVYPAVITKNIKTIAGEKSKQFNGWIVETPVVIPGIHTFKNGDPGYPDEMDARTILESTNIGEVVRKAVLYDLEKRVDGFLEAHFEAESESDES